MSAEEDNLDIDIYGDGGGDSYQEEDNQVTETQDEQHAEAPASDLAPPAESETAQQTATPKTEDPDDNRADADPQKIESTGTPIRDSVQMPKQAPQTQGLKRKEGPDDRPVEPSATTALFLSELHWWITDDDIRGWANQSGCEDELQEITFSEHKVNGKSKGCDRLGMTFEVSKSLTIRHVGKHTRSSLLRKRPRRSSEKSKRSVTARCTSKRSLSAFQTPS